MIIFVHRASDKDDYQSPERRVHSRKSSRHHKAGLLATLPVWLWSEDASTENADKVYKQWMLFCDTTSQVHPGVDCAVAMFTLWLIFKANCGFNIVLSCFHILIRAQTKPTFQSYGNYSKTSEQTPIGDNLNLAVVPFVERLSSSERLKMCYTQPNYLGPWKMYFVERSIILRLSQGVHNRRFYCIVHTVIILGVNTSLWAELGTSSMHY